MDRRRFLFGAGKVVALLGATPALLLEARERPLPTTELITRPLQEGFGEEGYVTYCRDLGGTLPRRNT